MNYHIEIRETLSKIVTVEASTVEEAIEQVRDQYYSENEVLTADNADCDTEFYDQTEAVQQDLDEQ